MCICRSAGPVEGDGGSGITQAVLLLWYPFCGKAGSSKQPAELRDGRTDRGPGPAAYSSLRRQPHQEARDFSHVRFTGLATRGNDCQNKQDDVRKSVNDWIAGLGF